MVCILALGYCNSCRLAVALFQITMFLNGQRISEGDNSIHRSTEAKNPPARSNRPVEEPRKDREAGRG